MESQFGVTEADRNRPKPSGGGNGPIVKWLIFAVVFTALASVTMTVAGEVWREYRASTKPQSAIGQMIERDNRMREAQARVDAEGEAQLIELHQRMRAEAAAMAKAGRFREAESHLVSTDRHERTVLITARGARSSRTFAEESITYEAERLYSKCRFAQQDGKPMPAECVEVMQ